MTDIERLAALVQNGTLLLPDEDSPNLVDLARVLASGCGALPLPTGPGAARIREALKGDGPLAFILVDGLGLDALSALPGDSFLRRHLAMDLRTVFPATTSAALVSLATGFWPGQHGVPAWFLYLEEAGLSVRPIPFDERFSKRSLSEFGVKPRDIYPLESWMGRVPDRSRLYVPESLKDTVFTDYLSGGAPVEGYRDYSECLQKLEDRLQQAGAGKNQGFYYGYIPDLDELSHDWGLSDGKASVWLKDFDGALEDFCRRLNGTARIVVSSDHGFTDIAGEGNLVLREPDPLLGSLRCPPAGDARAPFFHVKPGKAGGFRSEFSGRFGAHFALLNILEAEGLSLFGPSPLSALTRRRLGDFVGVSLDGSVLKYEGPGEEPNRDRGAHSGLTPAEMRIPLIVI